MVHAAVDRYGLGVHFAGGRAALGGFVLALPPACVVGRTWLNQLEASGFPDASNRFGQILGVEHKLFHVEHCRFLYLQHSTRDRLCRDLSHFVLNFDAEAIALAIPQAHSGSGTIPKVRI